jgi:hypothetical protein
MFSASPKQDWLMPSERGNSGSKWAIGSISDAYFWSSMGITECRNDTTLIHSYGCFCFSKHLPLNAQTYYTLGIRVLQNTLRNFSKCCMKTRNHNSAHLSGKGIMVHELNLLSCTMLGAVNSPKISIIFHVHVM